MKELLKKIKESFQVLENVTLLDIGVLLLMAFQKLSVFEGIILLLIFSILKNGITINQEYEEEEK